RGRTEEIAPDVLAERLAGAYTAYVVVDFRKLEQPCPEELAEPQYLLDWLDERARPLVSAVIIPHGDLASWSGLLKRGWGSDAVVCLFSRQERPVMLDHLRQRTRVKGGGGSGGAMLGWCWPSVMAPLLSHYKPEAVAELLAGIDAVLVELSDLPETWQVYGSNGIADTLARLGLERRNEGG